jgi:hypothetical protein
VEKYKRNLIISGDYILNILEFYTSDPRLVSRYLDAFTIYFEKLIYTVDKIKAVAYLTVFLKNVYPHIDKVHAAYTNYQSCCMIVKNILIKTKAIYGSGILKDIEYVESLYIYTKESSGSQYKPRL